MKKLISVLVILVLVVNSGVLMCSDSENSKEGNIKNDDFLVTQQDDNQESTIYYSKDNPYFDGHMLYYDVMDNRYSSWELKSGDYAVFHNQSYPKKIVLYDSEDKYWAVIEYKKPNPRNDKAFVKISMPSGDITKWVPMDVKENIDGGIHLMIEDIDEYIYYEGGGYLRRFKIVLSYN